MIHIREERCSFMQESRPLQICHKTVDLLRECGTLEYIHDPDGVAIFGDLHGSLYDLFRGIKDAGWPTDRTLIFLG